MPNQNQISPIFSRRAYAGLLALGLILPGLLLQGCKEEVKIPEVPSRTELPDMSPSKITLTEAQEQNLGIQVATVGLQRMSDSLQTTGKVQAVNKLMGHSYSPVSGQAVSIPVAVGQQVQQGEVLAVLRSDQIGQLEVDLLQQSLQTQADIQQAKLQLALSKTAFNRESRLFNENISSRADMETAQAQYKKDAAAVDALNAKQRAMISSFQSRLSLYGAAPSTARHVIQTRQLSPFVSLRAPKSGMVIDRNVNPGELVDTTKELFTVADLSRVWLVGDIYEKDLEKVQLKQPVSVTLDSMPSRHFDGKVTYIDAMLDPQARTLEIRSEVENEKHLLKPNMFARVAIRVGEKTLLSVPNTALQRNGDNLYVYVPLGNRVYEERKVGTGLVNGSHTEIINGLKQGEQVVTQGSLQLKGEVLKESARGSK